MGPDERRGHPSAHGQPAHPDRGAAGDPGVPDLRRPARPLPDDPRRRPPHGERPGAAGALEPPCAADPAPPRLDLRLAPATSPRRASRGAAPAYRPVVATPVAAFAPDRQSAAVIQMSPTSER